MRKRNVTQYNLLKACAVMFGGLLSMHEIAHFMLHELNISIILV